MNYPGFCAASYTSQSILTDYEECINWYPENVESPYAKSKTALYPTPGFQQRLDTGQTSGRAMETVDNITIAVMGTEVGQLNADSSGTITFTSYGTVAVNSSPAQIAFNGTIGNQALIVSGGNAYSLDLGTHVLTQVLSFASGGLTHAGMLDGYGLAFGSGRLWVSKINDMTSWDPTQYIQRVDAPDQWTAMLVVPPDVWMVGQQTGSVLYDAGSFPFPLAPRPGLNYKMGITAPFSIKASGYSVLWLSETREGSGIIVRTRGYAPVRVSTYAVEHNLALMKEQSDAESFIYESQGHTFYVLSFPTEETTWVYDLDLNYWSRRGYWNPGKNQYDRWWPRVHTRNFGQQLVGEWESGVISEMSEQVPTEYDGTAIRRLRRAPGIFSEHRNIPIQSIDLYLESGTSTPTGAGSNATFMWRTSDDGGRTWPVERQEPIGRIGNYTAMTRMWGFGVPRDRVNELVVSDPITSWRITDCYINNHAPGGGGGG